MKKVLFFLLPFLVFANTNAQIIKPVKWSTKVEKLSDSEFNLVMEGKIDEGWHVYSQFTPDGGPLPAEFSFKDAKGNYELVGKVKESTYKKQFNDIFGVDEYFFEKNVTFTQKVKVINTKLASIKAKIDYQVCKQSCINDNIQFTFQLPNGGKIAEEPVSDIAKTDTTSSSQFTVSEPAKPEKKVVVEEPKKEKQK